MIVCISGLSHVNQGWTSLCVHRCLTCTHQLGECPFNAMMKSCWTRARQMADLGWFAVVQMPIFTLQRSEEYYGKPQEFIPERWIEGSPEEAALNKKVPGSWMAFGEGTRVCVGQRFALQEAKITLARLYQRCELP
jgi:hypothetical protein